MEKERLIRPKRLCGVATVSWPRLTGLSVLLTVILSALFPAAGVAIDLPSETPEAPAPNPQAPVSPASQPTPAPAAIAAPAQDLRVGSRGATVRLLQRELRRRGYRYVRVDGAFGPSTRKAVRALQTRMRMRPTGIATRSFLRRLGIQASLVATTAPAPSLGASYLRAFPVLGDYTYINDWGFPRSQGTHQGTDIMADRGTPIVAVADGTIKRLTRVETGLGGIYVWLQDTSGNEYYYAHMASIAEGLVAGSRVAVGQVIGTVGNTGDARATLPHLHFEVHPGGGGAVNPYSELRAVDPKLRTG